jgi:hypothetical protein
VWRLSNDSTITPLVNNAGLGSAGKLLDATIDDLESMIYLNVTALTRLALAALPAFVARKNVFSSTLPRLWLLRLSF